MKHLEVMGYATGLVLAVCACGDESAPSHKLPWESNRTQVIEADGTVQDYDTPTGDACLTIEFVECVKPQESCDGNAADVVLDEMGQVIETICYPAGETLSVTEIEAQSGNVEQNQNDAVILLDGDAEIDVMGDLSVDANNVVVYGDGPDTSVISGDVGVDGNNMIVRGVRIQGDVQIDANNAVFLHCVIEGNVVVTGNNAVIAACDVLGSVRVQGNNTRLSGNHIAGELNDSGKNTKCESNLSADDANADGVLDSAELGAALECR
jgi:hypothetical protein